RGGPAPQDRVRDPTRRAVPAPDDRGQRRDRATVAGLVEAAHPGACRRTARPRRPRTGALSQALPERVVRWSTTAHRCGPRARRRPGRAADGRTVLGRRPDRPGTPAGRIPPSTADGTQDDRARDP